MKKQFKIFALIFAVWLALFNPVNISLIYAQEATPTDTPAATDTPAPTDTPVATPTPTPDQTLTTGDAGAISGSQTGSNVSDITTTPSPSPTDTPADTPIATDSATPDPDATPSATPTDTPTPTPSDISVDQTGTTSSDTTSAANTGDNTQADSNGTAIMTTGNAGSTANSITITNLSEVDSNLVTTIQNILTSDSGNVDLYALLEQAIAANPNFVPENTDVNVNQTADVTTNTGSTANTGDNTQDPHTATMSTGGAVALANAITAANLNLVGSNTMIAIINILADWNGNIILPNGQQLSLSSSGAGNVNVNANQSADVTSNTSSGANTGENSQTGTNTSMTTGNSTSGANSGTIANIIEIGNGQGFLIINIGGTWNGSLINWSAPGSSQTLGAGSYNLATEYARSGGTGSGVSTNVTSNQTANVDSNVTSSANTGGNSQTGHNTNLTTGNATSFANNFTLANYTGVGGGLFFGIINIIGNWTGNIISAYPELTVHVTDNQDSVTPGGAEDYTVTVANSGHATAHGVSLNFLFPSLVIPDGGQNTNWDLGDLGAGQSQTFNIFGHVNGNAQGGAQLLASANAGTGDAQDTTNGNSGSDTTDVVIPVSNPDTRTPDLHVDVWDNVGAFALPGDTVLAKITVTNNSAYPARNVQVKGSVTNDRDATNIPVNLTLGDLKVGAHAKISFDIYLKSDAVGGLYHLKAQATGQSDSGDTATSNLSQINFWVNGKTASASQFVVPPVLGGTTGGTGGTGTPEVLGISTDKAPLNIAALLPYVLPVLAGLYLFVILGRRRLTGVPLVSPAFINFFKKKGKVAFAGGVFVLLAAIGIFIKRNL